MPSALKTTFLELHKWARNEYLKVADLVSDNDKIDAAIKKLDEGKAGAAELALKVDKEEGKSLMTDAERTVLTRLDEKEEQIDQQLVILKERADIQWSEIKGARYEEIKNEATGVWTITAFKDGVKIGEKTDNPKNDQGKYITVIKIYSDGVVAATSTITEWKEPTGKWIREVK